MLASRAVDDVLVPIVWRVDIAERETRSAQARAMISDLERRGVALVATSFVDNSGIARVKSVPLRRLPQLAAWGVGFSPSFDYFRFDDWLAAPAHRGGAGRRSPHRARPAAVGAAGGPAGLGLGAGQSLRSRRRTAPRLHPVAAGPIERGARCRRAPGEHGGRAGVGRSRPARETRSCRPSPVRRTGWPGSPVPRTTPATWSMRCWPRRSTSSSSTPSTRPASSSCPLRPSRRSRPPTRPCWCDRRSARSAWPTASVRPSHPRSRSTAWATAATSISVSGARSAT